MSSSVPPSSISIQSASSDDGNSSLTVTEDKEETVTCLTRHSNPPPTISWLLGDTPLLGGNQTNTLEEESNNWASEATLQHMFVKADLGKTLGCVVTHTAYPAGQKTKHVVLDVLCE